MISVELSVFLKITVKIMIFIQFNLLLLCLLIKKKLPYLEKDHTLKNNIKP